MPRTRLPPLNAVRAFEAAARLGSFRAAGDELRVTPSAISHQIAKLEDFLGLALFDRAGRRVFLNAAGEAYFRQVDDALKRLAAATDNLTPDSDDATLIVLAAPSFVSKWLIPRIDAFLREHPEWRVRIEATVARQLSIGADIGIFYGKPEEQGLEVMPVVAERLLVLCSPLLLERGPPLRQPSDLARHVLIEANNRRKWRDWLHARDMREESMPAIMAVERSSSAIDAAVRGVGVILESDFLAADELAEGKLVVPFIETPPARPEDVYFLAVRETPRIKPAVGAFTAWIGREIARTRDEGRARAERP